MNTTETFQHYRVLRRDDGSLWELGRGAMGVTYKAFDTDLHSEVALKVVLPHALHNEVFRRRFLREARLAARLRHPNIAAIFHLGQTADGTHFYAMEFCEGETLQQVVDRRGPLPISAALPLVLQVSRALVLANEHGLVHRDIKPSNLILTQLPADGPVVKVIDFGLAKSYRTEGSTWASTGTNGFIGTAHFASPEQLENESVDGRSDIYSLGVTLWFLLTGQSMFGGSLARIISQHLAAPVPWEQLEGHDVPPMVRALLGGMLEKNPADRFRDALKLCRAVEECLAKGLVGTSSARVPVPASTRPAPARLVLTPAPVVTPAPIPKPATAAGSPLVPEDTPSATEGANVVLANRWQLVERCCGGPAGALFRALDQRRGRRSVAVKMLNTRLAADPEVCARLERTVNLQRDAPHENLLQPLAFGRDGAGGRFLILEWLEGFTLLAVLRARGTLALPETLRLLKALAAGFDHARQHGLTWLGWSKHQILFHFPGGFDDDQHRERTLHLPLGSWPTHRVVLDTMLLARPFTDGDETLVNLHTRLPAPDDTDAAVPSGDSSASGLEIAPLGRLIYELLGGSRAEGVPGAPAARTHYIPLASLTEAGNAVLRRAVQPAPDDSGFQTAREFHEALERAAGSETMHLAATTVPPEPPESSDAVPVVDIVGRLPSSHRRWSWLAAPALLVVAFLAVRLGMGHSSSPAQVSQTHPAPIASPSRTSLAQFATPAPAPAAALKYAPFDASTSTPAPVATPVSIPALADTPVPTPTPALAQTSAPSPLPAVLDGATPTPVPPTVATNRLPPSAAENPPSSSTPDTVSPSGELSATTTVDATPLVASTPTLADAAPTPGPTASATLPLPEGRLDHTESSPLGDLRVEYRQTDAGTALWLVPPTDESRRQLLARTGPDARVLFSPDEQWLLLTEPPVGGDNSSVQLLRRDPADAARYQVPDDFQRPGARLDDLAWGYYLGEVGLPPRTGREGIPIGAAEWDPNAAAFTLRISPPGDGATDRVPQLWVGRYDLVTRRFQAVTDVSTVRAALLERAKTMSPSATAATSPPAAPPLAGDWQKLIGGFVERFVTCDQIHDVPAALAYFAPSVDYFTDGRVGQAYIRSDILNFNQRWPVQRNRIVSPPELRQTTPGQSYTARFHVAFADESAPRREWSRGETSLELGIDTVRGVPLIVSIREKTLRREKGTLPAR